MKRTTLAILAALVYTSASLVIGGALAQQKGASSPSGQLDGFVGEGICTGNMMSMGKHPGFATTGNFRGEKTLDGRWVVIHYEENRTAANLKPFSVAQYMGYDAAKKHFVTVLFDNSGGAYGQGISAGWKEDTITFDEVVSMDGKQVSFRDTFTKGAAGMSIHTGMIQDKHGEWLKTDEEICHKVS